MRAIDIPEIEKLSTPEKVLLVEDLWDNITLDEFTVPIPHSHKEELDKRFQRYKSHPAKLLSLKELQGRIELRK